MKATFDYKIIRSPRRRTLTIEVAHDLAVTVRAPADAGEREIAVKVGERLRWIERQQAEFRRFHPLPKPPKFVAGETHYHLGRQYRLRIAENMPSSMVGIAGEYIEVLLRGPRTAKTVERELARWYRAESRRLLARGVEAAWLRLQPYDVPKPKLQLRTMPGRWGSCSPSGSIALNPALVRVPVHCIEYVAVHELCHLCHHDHGTAFYKLLGRVLPDWKARKQTLESWSEVLSA